MKRIAGCLLAPLLAFQFANAEDADARKRAGLDFFEAKIRPVLVERCYSCHSTKAATENKLKGGLLLDSRDGARRGGDTGPAVVPGDVDKSLLIETLGYESSIQMPPDGKLPEAIVTDFVKWIKIGAPDPRDGTATVPKKEIDIEAGRQLWSFQPLEPTAPPAVDHAAWVRTPIDRFIRKRQEEAGIAPNGVADLQTLIRRAHYDLIGLPPTPEDVTNFVAAAQQDFQSAYDALVDRLLASEHFGERWARHWLDIARFAESNGYAFDKDRPNAFRYRDFVIRAFNDDMPYDRFVRLQLAGDLLADLNVKTAAEARQATNLVAATGFLVAGPFTTQQTQKERERSRYQQLDDMVHTLGTSLLGLTLGCSRCHSHKYDPLPMYDYYRLASCFADVGFSNTGVNSKPEEHRIAQAKFNTVYSPLVAARAAFEKEHLPARFEAWFNTRSERPASPEIQPWQHVGPFGAEGADQAFDTVFPPEKGVDLTAAYPPGITWKEQPTWKDGTVHRTLTGTTAANYLFRVIETEVAQEIGVSLGSGDAIKLWINGKEILAKKIERKVAFGQERIQLPLQAGRNELLLKIVNFEGSSGFYFKSMSERPPEDVAELLAAPQAEWKEPERKKVLDWYKQLDPVWRDLHTAVLTHAEHSPKPELTLTYAAKNQGETYRFGDDTYKVYHIRRGNPDAKDKEARPGFLQVLMPADQRERVWFTSAGTQPSDQAGTQASGQGSAPDSPAKPARIALADWLTDVDDGAGHLLARVIVNRLWHHHFGRGIVSTCSDFGTRGEKPTHPQLLDWLALELVRGGWRLKPIHRLIVTSSAYMQAGGSMERAAKIDPENLLCWRRPPRRLEAEIIRDALLEVGGTLDRSMYGKGSLDLKTPRRSIYLTVKRSQLIRMLQLFDAPDTMQGIGFRQESTVAPQALAMLNSPMVREVATRFAAEARPDSTASLTESIDRAYRIALGRSPDTDELAAMETFIHLQRESRGDGVLPPRSPPGDGVLPPRSPQGDEEKASELAFLDFCHLVLCMNEFVYVD